VIGFAIFALLGAAAMVYRQGPGLTDPTKYHSDLTQSPNWVAYQSSAFSDDDLLVEYSAYNESPVQNLVYWIGTWFLDLVLLEKIVGILVFAGTAGLFFVLVARISGPQAAALAALLFAVFPRSAYEIAGGFSKGWATALVLVALFVVETRSWRVLIWLMPLAALAYPVSAVLIGAIALVGLVFDLPGNRGEALRGGRSLAIASALGVLPLLYKYLSPPERIGEMIPTETMKAMWESGDNTDVTLPLWREVLSYLEQPFYVYSLLLILMLLWRRGVVWRRSWTVLAVASTVCFFVADFVAPRLYLPDRYTRFSVAVLLVLWLSHNWSRVIDGLERPWLRRAAVVVVVGFAVVTLSDTFKPCDGDASLGVWEDHSLESGVARYMADEPDPVLVAGHPYYLGHVMVQSKKPVLVVHRMFHAWFRDYREAIDARNKDIFRALYATDVEQVNRLHEIYGVTHLMVARHHYDERMWRGTVYRQEYRRFIRDLVRYARGFVLNPPPDEAIVYEDRRFWLVKLPLDEPGE
jgi:hypothetical protein